MPHNCIHTLSDPFPRAVPPDRRVRCDCHDLWQGPHLRHRPRASRKPDPGQRGRPSGRLSRLFCRPPTAAPTALAPATPQPAACASCCATAAACPRHMVSCICCCCYYHTAQRRTSGQLTMLAYSLPCLPCLPCPVDLLAKQGTVCPACPVANSSKVVAAATCAATPIAGATLCPLKSCLTRAPR